MLDSLSALVDKSLVATEEFGDDRRYRMLFSIREYALERLREESEAQTIAEKHARFYGGFVRELQPLVDALEDAEWRRLLGSEIDNLRAAIDWTIFQGNDRATGLSLLADLEWPELITNAQEALRWYEHAAELVDEMQDSFVHSRILRHYAVLEYQAGRPVATCERTALHAVEVARGRTMQTRSLAVGYLGRLLPIGGALRRSRARAARGVLKARSRCCESRQFSVLRIWAVNDLQRGEIDLARRMLGGRTLGAAGKRGACQRTLNLGELEFATGHIERARAAAQQAENTYARLNSVYLVLAVLKSCSLRHGRRRHRRGSRPSA